jgi:hypothetical protein
MRLAEAWWEHINEAKENEQPSQKEVDLPTLGLLVQRMNNGPDYK